MNLDDSLPPSTEHRPPKTRRPHRKFSTGCRECKRRHMKCDEMRPSCANCSTADLRCSYVSFLSSTASPIPHPATAEPATTPSISPPPSTVTIQTEPQVFSLHHLELLHHIETGWMQHMGLHIEVGERMVKTVVESVLCTPYLMDRVLAMAAVHLSTISLDRRDFYCHQATQLQTRALTLFNAAQASVPDENCLAMFLFSSLLGQQVMYETFTTHDNMSTFLDRFADCLYLHRGVRAVAGMSWPAIEAQIKPILGDTYVIDPPPDSAGHECDALIALIDSADLGLSSVKAYRHAVESLQRAFDIQRAHASQLWTCVNVAMAWPVVVAAEFADLVKQQRPEALVILSYYAVILHRSRNFWVFAGAGEFLLHSISAHLGTYWERWLTWPKEIVQSSSKTGIRRPSSWRQLILLWNCPPVESPRCLSHGCRDTGRRNQHLPVSHSISKSISMGIARRTNRTSSNMIVGPFMVRESSCHLYARPEPSSFILINSTALAEDTRRIDVRTCWV